jgi:hypothetical protein
VAASAQAATAAIRRPARLPWPLTVRRRKRAEMSMNAIPSSSRARMRPDQAVRPHWYFAHQVQV